MTASRGEFILRVNAAGVGASDWERQLRVLRRAAERGVAGRRSCTWTKPNAQSYPCARQACRFGAALPDPAQRDAAIASIVALLRALHALDTADVDERDPIAYAREQYDTQRSRPGFPAWAAGLDPILDRVETALARDPRRVVSHNDLNPGNVLWDGKRAWLVNWEVAGLAHPFYDLAVLAMFLQLGLHRGTRPARAARATTAR